MPYLPASGPVLTSTHEPVGVCLSQLHSGSPGSGPISYPFRSAPARVRTCTSLKPRGGAPTEPPPGTRLVCDLCSLLADALSISGQPHPPGSSPASTPSVLPLVQPQRYPALNLISRADLVVKKHRCAHARSCTHMHARAHTCVLAHHRTLTHHPLQPNPLLNHSAVNSYLGIMTEEAQIACVPLFSSCHSEAARALKQRLEHPPLLQSK